MLKPHQNFILATSLVAGYWAYGISCSTITIHHLYPIHRSQLSEFVDKHLEPHANLYLPLNQEGLPLNTPLYLEQTIHH